MTRILVTGSRHFDDLETMVDALNQAWLDLGKPVKPTLVHGAAKGADAMAAGLWKLWGWPTEAHAARWDELGKKAGIVRNAEMVALGADLALAFPLPDSRGTVDCMRRAQAAGIPVRTFRSRSQGTTV